jgi:predicted phosphodiesterase
MSDRMTVAILADIHGNVEALDAVLTDIDHHHPDLVVFAGDLIMNGPRPTETLARLSQLNAPSVIGNTDIHVVEAATPVARWTREQISDGDIAYLQSLPLTYRITPPDNRSPDDDLLVMHSTPHSSFDVLILGPHPLGTTFTAATPYQDAVLMLDGHQANLMVYGHIHYFSDGLIDGQHLMSIGSVGFPFDGDHRAAYALARWNGRTWQIDARRVSYDHEHVARDIEQIGIPFASRYARMIREANWLPFPQP